eukprot:CAMPEP_0181487428 /NCGR_PEP_ID=MMETSP1110-20121109/47807_1 /TAXON_ID=174948 /ORGANISM="Symbiodinium sp., Strain CCMP421" /LENGTH=194 /DNA_ID=CAMNT_0023613921 /DNA_START=59 /DNA_END=643 /DNA_ORIENTATION=-
MSGRGRSRFVSGRGLSHVAAVVGSFLIVASLLSIARLFVATPQTASRGALLARRAAPALAPAPTRSSQPSAPLPIDHSRYGEKVRWYAEPQMSRPPEWRVLLLDKTFRNPSNTISKVAACLVATLGIASAMARIKAQHARDHFFSVVTADENYNEAVRKAKALQDEGLVVRVVPGTSRSSASQRKAELVGVRGR